MRHLLSTLLNLGVWLCWCIAFLSYGAWFIPYLAGVLACLSVAMPSSLVSIYASSYHGLSLDYTSHTMAKPLFFCYMYNCDMASFLQNGVVSLWFASGCGHVECVKVLLYWGAEANRQVSVCSSRPDQCLIR